MQLCIISIANATRLDYLTNVKQAIDTHKELSSIFIAISSHGLEGDKILCEDYKYVSVSEIIAMLQIPELISKPKVSLIEACRGKSRDQVETDSTPENFVTYPAAMKESDFLVAYSCVPDYEAYRETSKGSWSVNAFSEAYETAGNEDFARILTFANSLMLDRNF
ncbi:hypothetical protein LOD99_11419 [Oopsacas minuta]|uniref:Caspase family p20 domain-containing protein n=1 Tax=Oopsacas minuta TaxID=111878 RepID=A0AAV7K425_9METZ|nr:hypothetical protein LOD99_11419 [Oopsacas minuta]